MFVDPVTLEVLGKNIHMLFIDADSFQLMIFNLISLLVLIKKQQIYHITDISKMSYKLLHLSIIIANLYYISIFNTSNYSVIDIHDENKPKEIVDKTSQNE